MGRVAGRAGGGAQGVLVLLAFCAGLLLAGPRCSTDPVRQARVGMGAGP